MTWSDIQSIFVFVMAATGVLCWICMILLVWFFWMCRRPPEKE